MCNRQKIQATTIQPFATDDSMTGSDIPKGPLDFVKNDVNAEGNDITWEVVANLFDTICFYLNFLLVLITGIAMVALFAI